MVSNIIITWDYKTPIKLWNGKDSFAEFAWRNIESKEVATHSFAKHYGVLQCNVFKEQRQEKFGAIPFETLNGTTLMGDCVI